MSQLQLLNSSAAAAGASSGAAAVYVDDVFSTDVYQGVTPVGNAQYVAVTNNINLSDSESGGSILMPGNAADQVNVSASDNGNFNFGSGNFTIEGWLKTRQTGRADPFGANYNYTDTGWYGLIGNLSNSGDLAWYEGSNSVISGTGTGWNDGGWHHVAITRSGNSVRLFLDGTQVGSTYTTSYSYGQSGGGFRFGDLWPGGTGQYMGFYSHFRVIKDTALYTSNFTPPSSPLTEVSGTKLLIFNSSELIEDSSSQNNTVAVYGDTYATGYGPFTIEGENVGGLVMIKNREGSPGFCWMDTETNNAAPTFGRFLQSTSTDAMRGFNKVGGPFFNKGFVLGTSTDVSEDDYLFLAGVNYVSHTFRKYPGFFDIVRYTGNGTNPRTISHNLGSEPGLIVIKSTSNSNTSWPVYAYGGGGNLFANTTAANLDSNRWIGDVTDTTFRVGGGSGGTNVNESGHVYVAYLFARGGTGFGEDGTETVINTGYYTGNETSGKTIELGWEPQYIMIKLMGSSTDTTSTGNWIVYDSIRGITLKGVDNNEGTAAALYWNLINANTATTDTIIPTATGFRITTSDQTLNYSPRNYAYIAVRHWKSRPPESAEKVFDVRVYTGNNTDNRLVKTGLCKPDLVWVRRLSDPGAYGGVLAADRYRGNDFYYTGAYTGAQISDLNTFMTAGYTGTSSSYGNTFTDRRGIGLGNDTSYEVNSAGDDHIVYSFKQAKGFFDMVPYLGTGAARNISHSLGVSPELMLVRRMNATDSSIYVYYGDNTDRLLLNTSEATVDEAPVWNDTSPTSSVFTVGTGAGVNNTNDSYVAYLFASYPGISKIGTYTGTASSQNIDCGFTTGARFVLVKRVNDVGNWVVFDTARGITINDDPTFYFDATNAQNTPTTFNINPYSAGFTVVGNNNALNGSGSTYIYLAIA